MSRDTNSFSIAQYILLFLVVVLCIGIVAWTLVHTGRNMKSENPATNVVHITNTDPCVQNIMNVVSQTWAYNPNSVPQKYLDLATQYANAQITTRIHGACNEITFVCRPGQIRRDCDPCALSSARQIAMDQQIADMIQSNCPETAQ